MMQDLEQIEYRKRMIEKGMKTPDLPVKVWRGAKIPAEARKAVNEENLLNLGGIYGDKRAGDPVKYDHLKLVLTDDMTRELLNDDRVLTCGPVIFEINQGLRHSEHKGITSLFDALTRLPVEEGAWEQAGDLDASLRRKGITIPPMDILIAQTCRHYDVSLFTLDEHFSSVPGLKLFQT
jgi:predicted nucleic acid-binding protein